MYAVRSTSQCANRVGVLLGGVAEWQRLSESTDGAPHPSEAVFWTDMLVAAAGGRLVQVLPQYSTPDADIYAVYPQRHQLAVRVRAFVDFMVASWLPT